MIPAWHKGPTHDARERYELSLQTEGQNLNAGRYTTEDLQWCGAQVPKMVAELLNKGNDGQIYLCAPNGRHKVVVTVSIIPDRPAKLEGKKVSWPLQGFLDSMIAYLGHDVTLGQATRRLATHGRDFLAMHENLEGQHDWPKLDILCDDIAHELELMTEANGSDCPVIQAVPSLKPTAKPANGLKFVQELLAHDDNHSFVMFGQHFGPPEPTEIVDVKGEGDPVQKVVLLVDTQFTFQPLPRRTEVSNDNGGPDADFEG